MANDTNSNRQTHIQERENRPLRNIAYCFPLGMGTGVALGVMFDNLALGFAVGTALGALLGMTVTLNRAGAADPDPGTTGRRWIAVFAIGGVVFLAAGIVLLFFLIR